MCYSGEALRRKRDVEIYFDQELLQETVEENEDHIEQVGSPLKKGYTPVLGAREAHEGGSSLSHLHEPYALGANSAHMMEGGSLPSWHEPTL